MVLSPLSRPSKILHCIKMVAIQALWESIRRSCVCKAKGVTARAISPCRYMKLMKTWELKNSMKGATLDGSCAIKMSKVSYGVVSIAGHDLRRYFTSGQKIISVLDLASGRQV